MTLPASPRFKAEPGHLLIVETPPDEAPAILSAMLDADPLAQGDYDRVAFTSAPGRQQFRSLGTGRNAATEGAVAVPCAELRVFTTLAGSDLARLVETVYAAHPYEEPVIFLVPATRTRHRPGQDQDNPNRFWNRPMAPGWVPKPHR